MPQEFLKYRNVAVTPTARSYILKHLKRRVKKGGFFRFVSLISSGEKKYEIIYHCNEGEDPLEGVYLVEAELEKEPARIYLQTIRDHSPPDYVLDSGENVKLEIRSF